MPGKIWLDTASRLADTSTPYRKFYNGIGTRQAVIIGYSYGMARFMRFLVNHGDLKNETDFEGLTKFTSKEITNLLQEYVFDCNKRVKGISTRSYLSAPELFFDMNDLIWNRRIVKKSIHRDDGKAGGSMPASDSDVTKILKATVYLNEIALLHFLFSTGIRPGAIADPILCIRHLVRIENCYAVKVYDESKEGYWSFLTPEATQALDDYLEYRKQKGEMLDDDSILFKTRFNTKTGYLKAEVARDIVSKLLKRAGIKRIKTGNRYDKAVIYMFRKRFNGKLKLDDSQINSSIAEKLMAHNSKEIKLDSHYLEPTMEQCFKEFKKAIPELTISSTERQRIQIEAKQKRITELEAKQKENDSLKDQISQLESKMVGIEKRSNMPTISIEDLSAELRKLLQENPQLLQVS